MGFCTRKIGIMGVGLCYSMLIVSDLRVLELIQALEKGIFHV